MISAENCMISWLFLCSLSHIWYNDVSRLYDSILEALMFYDYLVDIPVIKGRIFEKKTHTKSEGNIVYIEFQKERIYNPERKNTSTRRTTIGKKSSDDPVRMFPNENYYKLIDDPQYPKEPFASNRSGCLRVGSYFVIKKVIEECRLDTMLTDIMGSKNAGLFLDLAAYSIITEDNAAQYYPEYAYNHPLFTEDMRIYSDSTISAFLREVNIDHRLRFLELWNAEKGRQDKIYISYDSTNKDAQSGELSLAEISKASKSGTGKPVFNYAVIYDEDNREPLFYERYPGSIVDVSQLQYVLEKIRGYGYRNICMILDRGYFAKENIQYMDGSGISFIMMVKGNRELVNSLILEHKGEFEDLMKYYIKKYDVNGMTVKAKLYKEDARERYFHLYYDAGKHAGEKTALMQEIGRLEKDLQRSIGKEEQFTDKYHHYFELYYKEEVTGKDDNNKEIRRNVLHGYIAKNEVIDQEVKTCGYFSLITSDEMTARDAYIRYKSRDASEKLFRGDKSYLGDRTMRVHGDEPTESKLFIEFAGLIIRNRIYTHLLDEMLEVGTKSNFMTVPAALKELEKIEIIRLPDGVYRMDHAISAKQKAILKAFGLTAGAIRTKAVQMGKQIPLLGKSHEPDSEA